MKRKLRIVTLLLIIAIIISVNFIDNNYVYAAGEVVELKDVPIGDIVYDADSIWEWKDNTGAIRRTAPVEWLVIEHGHFNINSTVLVSKDNVAIRLYDSDNSNIWSSSSLRTWLRGTFRNHLSDDFKNNIVDVTTYSEGASSVDNIFILSQVELGGGNDYISDNHGNPIAYFNSKDSRISQSYIYNNKPIENGSYWTRSPESNSFDKVRSINYDGRCGANDTYGCANYKYLGVRPALNLKSDTEVKKQSDGRWKILWNQNPTITLAQPTSNSSYSAVAGYNTMTVSGTVTDTDAGDLLTVKYRIDGSAGQAGTNLQTNIAAGTNKPYSGNVNVGSLAEGNHTLYVWVEDNNGGKSAETSRAFKIDKTAPSVTFGTNGNSTYAKSQSSKVTVTDSVAGISTLKYAWSTSTSTPAAGNFISFSSGATLTQSTGTGAYYLHIEAIDKVGNKTNTRSNAFNIDNTAPTVTFATNGNISPQKSHSTVVNAADPHSGINTLQYQWSTSSTFPTAGTWTNFSTGATLTQGSGNGNYYLHIKTVDKAGNETKSTSGLFLLDNTPPVKPTITQSPVAGSWTGGNVTVTISYSTDSNIKEYKIGSGAWQNYTVPLTISDNNTSIYARATDLAGNVSAESSITVANIDKIAPTVNPPTITVNSTSQITIKANASDAQSGLHATPYNFNIDGVDMGYQAGNYIHSNLLPNTLHSYKYKARDEVGNESGYSSIVANYTKAKVPSIDIIGATQTSISGTVLLNGNSEGTETYVEIADNSGFASPDLVKTWNNTKSFNATGLDSGKTYYLRVKARNGDGENTDWSDSVSKITIPSTPTAPNVTADEDTNKMNISWNTITGAASYILYRDNTIIYEGIETSYEDNGLKANKSYSYSLKSINASGESNMGNATVKYTRALNPTKIQVLEIGIDYVRFKIQNNPNNDVEPKSKIILKRNNVSEGTSSMEWSSNEITISGLNQGQIYKAYIKTRNENSIENDEIGPLNDETDPILVNNLNIPISDIKTVVPIAEFKIVDTSVSTIKVEWNNTIGQEYQVYVNDEFNNEKIRSNWLSSDGQIQEYVFKNLYANTKYIMNIITRIKDIDYTSDPLFISTYTDAEGIGRARFIPGEDFIEIELAVESSTNPDYTEYEIRNSITTQSKTVTHDNPIWKNTGLAKESEYEYTVQVVNKNEKTTYPVRLTFEDGLNGGKSAHTIIKEIEFPDDFLPEYIQIDVNGETYNPNNMKNKEISINGTDYVLTNDKNVLIKANKGIENATQFSINTNNIGFNRWYDIKEDKIMEQAVIFNTPGFYKNEIKFKNSLGRETKEWAELNFLADWIPPEVTAEKKIPNQTATSNTFTIVVNATDNISPALFYSIDNGSTWHSLTEGIKEITFANVEKSSSGILNNLTIKVGDLCGNVTEKSFAIWGISN